MAADRHASSLSIVSFRSCLKLLLLGLLSTQTSADGTEQRLERAVMVTPRSPKAHHELINWHLHWNDTEKALDAVSHALEVDSDNAWRYHQRAGDIHYDIRSDLKASKLSYGEALKINPRARRSILRYGDLCRWDGANEEADKLFSNAVEDGLLRNVLQRPVDEFISDIPSDGAWINTEKYLLLDDAMETLAHPKVIEILRDEYRQWATEYAGKDSLVSKESDPAATGRHLQFWIHRPHFVDGVWRDTCAHETPKICQALQSLNESGGIQIHAASFEILESGASVRPHCHKSNAELLIDVCLQAPPGPVFTGNLAGEQRPWVPGEVSVLDGSFEHILGNQAKGGAAVALRLVVRHVHLPCVGSFEVCGIRGVMGNVWRWLKRTAFGAPDDITPSSDAPGSMPDEL